MKPFVNGEGRSLKRVKQTLSVHYEEKSVTDRREASSSPLSVWQMESVHFVSAEGIQSETAKPRLHFGGTTAGSLIGPAAPSNLADSEHDKTD